MARQRRRRRARLCLLAGLFGRTMRERETQEGGQLATIGGSFRGVTWGVAAFRWGQEMQL